jgi:hypothetical protein
VLECMQAATHIDTEAHTHTDTHIYRATMAVMMATQVILYSTLR